MQDVIPCVNEALSCLLRDGITEAMNKYNSTDFRKPSTNPEKRHDTESGAGKSAK
jgi:hypothetical protein